MLLNKSAVRTTILSRAKVLRPGHEFTQVAPTVYLQLDQKLRRYIDDLITRHPSTGKTIKQILC
jgi:hypothetical protein